MSIVWLLAGLILFALASYAFWRIGRTDGISPRWRDSTTKIALIVLFVLSGWSGGVSLAIVAVVAMIAT